MRACTTHTRAHARTRTHTPSAANFSFLGSSCTKRRATAWATCERLQQGIQVCDIRGADARRFQEKEEGVGHRRALPPELRIHGEQFGGGPSLRFAVDFKRERGRSASTHQTPRPRTCRGFLASTAVSLRGNLKMILLARLGAYTSGIMTRPSSASLS